MVKVEIVGIDQVHEVLNGLPKRWQKSVLRSSLKKVTPLIRDAAIRNVPSETVKKQVDVFPLKKSPLPGWWIGWSLKKRDIDYNAAQGRAKKAWAFLGGFWLEFGTSGRWRKKQRLCRKIEPVGWFRRAVDTNIDKTESEFMKYLQSDLNKFLDRKIKKYGW